MAPTYHETFDNAPTTAIVGWRMYVSAGNGVDRCVPCAIAHARAYRTRQSIYQYGTSNASPILGTHVHCADCGMDRSVTLFDYQLGA